MGEYWRLLGRYNAETQTFSGFAGTPNSPYTHDETAKLIGLRVIVSAEAATSLTEGVRIRLTCTGWKPNMLEIVAAGTGLRTVPCSVPPVYDYAVNQPVTANLPITLEGMCVEATHVTNSVYVLGKFVS